MPTPLIDHLRSSLASERALRRTGRISAVAGGRIRVTGLSDVAALGDHVSFPGREIGPSGGEVVELDEATVTVLPEALPDGFSIGQPVLLDGTFRLRPDDSWLGRVIDPTARPLDGRPIHLGLATRPLIPISANPDGRRGLGRRIATGLALFDTLLPIVRGQRLGLFAGSGVGKSTLLARLAMGVETDVVVVALIGERGREVREFVDRVLGPAGMKRAVVVAATADQSPLLRRRCIYTAMTVAEHFRDAGRHVLLLADSITRFAEAHREIALSGGEANSMRGYPPSTAQRIMALAERAGPGSGAQSDITAIFTVLVPGSDMEEPVADILRGVLDGHIVLDRSIAERGRFPSVDVSRSLSRALPEAASEAENVLIAQARSVLGAYERSELMIRAGLYAPGADPAVDRAVDLWPRLDGFFSKASPTGIGASFADLRACLSRSGDEADGASGVAVGTAEEPRLPEP